MSPPPGEVHIWRIPLDVSAPRAALGLQERERADALLFSRDRRRFVAAHAAVRTILARYLPAGHPERRHGPEDGLEWRRGPEGKPEVPGLEFNLSHSGGLALLAVSGWRPVGVDVERVRPGLPAAALAARFFRPEEAALVASAPPALRAQAYLRLWTRKEACVKAAGGLLAQALSLPVTGRLDAYGPGTRPAPDPRGPGPGRGPRRPGPEGGLPGAEQGAVRGLRVLGTWLGWDPRVPGTWSGPDPRGLRARPEGDVELPGPWPEGDVEVPEARSGGEVEVPRAWLGCDLRIPGPYVAAVALAGRRPYRVVVRTYPREASAS